MTMGYASKERKLEYQRKWKAARRAAYFRDKSCARCGSTENLELDHIDPTQKTAHNIWSWSDERREAELAKCQVLCHTCHVRKTAQYIVPLRFGHEAYTYAHGTYMMYQNWKCRCEKCRAFNTLTLQAARRGENRPKDGVPSEGFGPITD